MIPLGLTASQQAKYEQTLASSYEMSVRVNVLNTQGQFRTGLTPYLLDGQVNVDGSGERTTRIAQMSFLDPDRTFHFDPDSPSEHALYRNRTIQVFWDIFVPTVGWVEVPVQEGPCTSFVRNGAYVEVEVAGADYNGNTQHTWDELQFDKGDWVTDCIKKLLRQRCTGIRKLAIPDLRAPKFRLPQDRDAARMTHPFAFAKKLGHGIDRQLFVDGAATARLRVPPKNPIFVFRDGNDGMLSAEPQRTFADDEDFANGWWATGRVLKGAKKPLEVRRFLPREHDLSPHSLGDVGPTGVDRPYRVVGRSNNPGFRRVSMLVDWTADRLDRAADGTVEVAAEVYCTPHLDVGDMIAVRTAEFNERAKLTQFSIPLLPGQTMSIGYHKEMDFGKARGGPIVIRKPKRQLKIDKGPVGHVIDKKKRQ